MFAICFGGRISRSRKDLNMGSEEGVKYDSWYSTCTTLQMLAMHQEGFGGEASWEGKCRAQFGHVKLEMTVRCPKMKLDVEERWELEIDIWEQVKRST